MGTGLVMKGNNYCDLFASAYDLAKKGLPKRGLLLNEIICSKGANYFL